MHYSSTNQLSSNNTNNRHNVHLSDALLSDSCQTLSNHVRQTTQAIAIFDPSVENYQQLIAGLHSHITPYILDAKQDGIQQITQILQNSSTECSRRSPKSKIQNLEVHLISHGSPGTLYLGNTELSLSTLDRYTEELKAWFNPKSELQNPTSELLLYGCNVAAGDAGEEFITKLHKLTGAEIAASTTPVGSSMLGGNWEFDAFFPHSLTRSLPPLSQETLTAYSGILMPDTDNDNIVDAIDLDDDNDGILDTDEGFIPAPNLLPDGEFERDDIIGGNDNASATVVLDSDGLVIATVDPTQRFATDVDFNNFNNNGTVDWSEGQYTERSSEARSVVEWDGLQIQQSPVGGGFGIFSFNGEEVSSDLSTIGLVDGREYTVSAYVGVLPEYKSTQSDTPSFNLNNFEFGIIGTGADDVTLTGSVLNGGNGYTLADYATNQEAHDATTSNPEILNPFWELVAFTFTYDASVSGAEEIFFRTSGGVVVTVDSLTLQEAEGTGRDTDNDGIDDHLDLDSDNDGISDLIESGQNASLVDVDGDGTHNDGGENYGSDGISTDANGGSGVTPINSDTDGIANFIDLDSDNDGIPDAVEAQATNTYTSATSTNNATNDGVNDNGLFIPIDTNTDGTPDYLDTDSDGDTVDDAVESGLTPGSDGNNDGIGDNISASYADPDGNINNPSGALASDGTITPTHINEVDYRNVAPVVNNDSSTGNPTNTSVLVDVLDNDNDDGTLDPATVDLDPGTTGVQSTLVVPGEGTWTVNPTTGEVTFAPEAGFTGDPTPISYTVDDNDGLTSTSASITVDYDNDQDTDSDGIPDVADIDDDNDGILDTDEGDGTLDTDGDGIPDSLDLDADNDGILDVDEAGHGAADVDGDGTVDGPVGSNGLPDAVETTLESGIPSTPPIDTDGDGIEDFQDLDSDNDGINDVIEAGGTDPDGDGIVGSGTPTDVDDDGILDVVDVDQGGTPVPILDTDGDGVEDYQDLDSDNDGTNDVVEVGNSDTNGDGQVDGPDTDGDGIRDSVDPAPGFGDQGGSDTPDTDGDGVADHQDLDSDNDGINDVIESDNPDTNGDGQVDGPDTDGDGIRDTVDPAPGFGDSGSPTPPDTDGDGVPDRTDLDSDNDGILDVTEAGNPDSNGDGQVDGDDTDNDGIRDVVDPAPTTFGDVGDSTDTDTDDDGVEDYRDLDSDNDGIPDVIEGGGSDPDRDGIIGTGTPTDIDGDGIANDIDPSTGGTPVSVPDLDEDGDPDYQDLDSDNDGRSDLSERGGLTDTNNDGRVDGPDSDGDGLLDAVDGSNGIFGTGSVPMDAPQDTDGDGIPDFQELPSTTNGGSQGSDDITGTDGNDILNGFSDVDVLRGGAGDDIINGGSSRDTIRGDSGNDTLNGGSNDDDIDGGSGNDILNGGSGNDLMRGRGGRDILNGGQGRDRIFGGNGNDTINGSGSRDRLFGEKGRDKIRGGEGNDIIVGGFGKDTLTGGQGRDRFVYESIRDFRDKITDFEILKDKLDVREIGGVSSMNDVVLNQRGDDLLIKLDTNRGLRTFVTLDDVDAETISKRHFIF
ncbi:MAG: DUF4347 domain-containing protein [Cyanobacteria bacterium P01_A01_bin.37]